MSFESRLLLAALAGVASAAATGSAQATVDCSRHQYRHKPLSAYTLKRGDSCFALSQNPNLHFSGYRQVERINFPISGFTCPRARAGQIICYPSEAGDHL